MPINPEERKKTSEEAALELEKGIAHERSEIRKSVLLAFVCLIIGTIGTFAASSYWAEAKPFTPFGVGITLLIFAYYLRSVPWHWNRKGTCIYLKEKFEKVIENPKQISAAEFKKMEELFGNLCNDEEENL